MPSVDSFHGLKRSAWQAFASSGSYFLSGLLLVPIGVELFFPKGYGDLTGVALLVHSVSALALWPTSVLAHLALWSVCPWGFRRHQPWRDWVAGILAVPFVWLGFPFFASVVDGWTPVLRRSSLQGLTFVLFFSVAVMLCNAAILVAWALPPWRFRAARL